MLTINNLAETLAEFTGCTSSDAESFLRELFALTAQELESEGGVEVPCLGRFAIMDGTVIYQPDEELAAAVNAPFADFQPVELPDGFDLNPEERADEITEGTVAPELEPEHIEEPPIYNPGPEPQHQLEPLVPEVVPEPQPLVPDIVIKKQGLGCCWVLMIAFASLVVGFIAGWFASAYRPMPVPESAAVLAPECSETPLSDSLPTIEPVEEVQTERPLVLDTVRAGRFLATMARNHYGQMDYWVYIYEANAAKMGNPDYLEAGTVVIVPPADSLGLEPGNAEKIAEAKRKANEIYARFN